MRKTMLAAFGAATMLFGYPAAAQDIPLVSGSYWSVTEVTISDGHFSTYADFLASDYRKEQDFMKSKGWIKDYYILGNNNKRAGEPDLYLVQIFDHMTTPAEDISREKELNAFLAQSTRQGEAGSGERAKYRTIGGTMLLREQRYRK
ncbi:hypothetical protein LZ518_06210 [Sphingomonas sp. RB56-2]|uniref:DUF2147 domain-containing protein n=1 Tax=Sphingomonas brevis TaxID=2908206 RepID=A0ABT0S8I0_9SPHN|nr:hypothetical protein [Sphingomonas brevis]MCL6740725.1 hypothetical protein [Sphingomonas brevis]